MRILIVVSLIFSFLTDVYGQVKPFKIDSDFPGGDIIVDSVKKDSVFIHQNLSETVGNWFYWDFRVRGAAKRKLIFKFTHPWGKDVPKLNVIGLKGPGVSFDSGKTWAWLGTGVVSGNSFTYQFGANQNNVMFSFAMPYTGKNLTDFLKPYKNNINLSLSSLAITREGRVAEKLRLGNIYGKPKYKIVLTARHHACEMMTSYILEGLIQFVLKDNNEGKWLRENVELLIIPFVDKDGVEDGDQGKDRVGRDHNRDYSGNSLYATTQALRNFLPVWSEGKLIAAFDLHCPYIRGAVHERVHQVGQPQDSLWQAQVKFGSYLQAATSKSAIPYYSVNDLKFGTSWNIPVNFTKGQNFTTWVSSLKEVKLATIIEYPYAIASGKTVDQANSRLMGKDLSIAIVNYLKGINK